MHHPFSSLLDDSTPATESPGHSHSLQAGIVWHNNFTYNNYISLIDKGLAKVIDRAFSPNNL
jgi:hypothetical protein